MPGICQWTGIPYGLRPGSWPGMLDLVENPGARKRPIDLCRGDRNTQDLRCFLIGHADEISQLDHFGFNWMFLGEIVQYLMHGEQLLVSSRSSQILPLHINSFETATVTLGELAPRPVDKNAAHRLSG